MVPKGKGLSSKKTNTQYGSRDLIKKIFKEARKSRWAWFGPKPLKPSTRTEPHHITGLCRCYLVYMFKPS
jgi:hypothetical protein